MWSSRRHFFSPACLWCIFLRQHFPLQAACAAHIYIYTYSQREIPLWQWCACMWLLNFSCLHVSFRIWYRVITRVLPHLLEPRSSGQPPNCSLFLSLSCLMLLYITIASHDQIISLSLVHLRAGLCEQNVVESDGTRLLLYFGTVLLISIATDCVCAPHERESWCFSAPWFRDTMQRGQPAICPGCWSGNARSAGGPLWAPSPGSLVALSRDNPL